MFYVDADRCTGCALCAENCPQGAITMSEDKAVIDPERCSECETCVEICNNDAVREQEKRPSVTEVAPSIQKKPQEVSFSADRSARQDTSGDPPNGPSKSTLGVFLSLGLKLLDYARDSFSEKGKGGGGQGKGRRGSRRRRGGKK